jgi:hypothetical protein
VTRRFIDDIEAARRQFPRQLVPDAFGDLTHGGKVRGTRRPVNSGAAPPRLSAPRTVLILS